ncbi:MAG: crossover junction endodeoxyribonuclease RuvC [Firmicutes bacterium]|nr:crossover junction endodeoxyribonuclease RuvC [Bacillota bacterium]
MVLGIDPGTHRTGFAAVEERGGRPVAVEYGVITTAPGLAPGERLRRIYDRVRALVEGHRPSVAAVERLFLGANAPSAVSVGQARGVVLLALAQAGVPVHEYTPSAVKTAIVGYGRADKAQVQEMVRVLFRLDRVPRPDDAADALAVAVCALNHAASGRWGRVGR